MPQNIHDLLQDSSLNLKYFPSFDFVYVVNHAFDYSIPLSLFLLQLAWGDLLDWVDYSIYKKNFGVKIMPENLLPYFM
jgi:hypothetical protein